jgi:hypothetical protein
LQQNPGKGWPTPAVELKAYYNRLGNKALPAGTVNSKLNNVEFKSKKAALSKSDFSLTSSNGSNNQCGANEIIDRQKKLATHAVKAWPLAI